MAKQNNYERDLYRMYGIAEWSKKCALLEPYEITKILEDLKQGIDSELVILAKMPFPHFVRLYLSKYPASARYFDDPAFGYKLFFLNETALKIFEIIIKIPELKMVEFEKLGFSKKETWLVQNLLWTLKETPLDKVAALLTTNDKRNNELNFIYLTQYIDLEEARRMDLSLLSYFEKDGADGYELDSKLDMLNTAVRLIMTLTIGLYGEKRHTKQEIREKLGISEKTIGNIQNKLMPYFQRPTGELKSYLGYAEKSQDPQCIKQYANRQFRDLDISAQVNFIMHNLSETEQLVLSSYSTKEQKLYIAAKYIFKTPESLAKNMNLSSKEATQRIENLPKF